MTKTKKKTEYVSLAERVEANRKRVAEQNERRQKNIDRIKREFELQCAREDAEREGLL